MRKLILLVSVLTLLPAATPARTWYIQSDGGGDAATIQAGLNSAAPGDTVLVGPGTYYENLQMRGGVVLESEQGADNTVIDGSHAGYVIRCSGVEDCDVVGFTLTNGLSAHGACILVQLGSIVTIRGNVIVENTALGTGAGIYCDNSSPVIIYNLIVDNGVGGIYCSLSDPVIANNTIYSNGLGAIILYRSSPAVDHNIAGGSQFGIACQTGSDPTLWCNDVWNNTIADYTCTAGAMDFSADPLFCDTLGGDFHVEEGSPCVGHASCGLIGVYGAGCGPTSATPSTWGSIKSLYR